MPDDDQYPLEDTPYFTYLKRRKRYRVEDRAGRFYEHPIRISGIGIEIEHTETAYDTRVTEPDGTPNNSFFAMSGSGSFSTSLDLTRIFSDKAPREHKGGLSDSKVFQFSHQPYRPWLLSGPWRVFKVTGVGSQTDITYVRSPNPLPPYGWGPWELDEDNSGPYDVTIYLDFVVGETKAGAPEKETGIRINVTSNRAGLGSAKTFYRNPWESTWDDETKTEVSSTWPSEATTTVKVKFT